MAGFGGWAFCLPFVLCFLAEMTAVEVGIWYLSEWSDAEHENLTHSETVHYALILMGQLWDAEGCR